MNNNENNALTSAFLERTFFSTWKNIDSSCDFSNVELQLNTICDQKCTYCYYAKHGKELYPPEISHSDLIMSNLGKVLDWIVKNEYRPMLNFFSGEVFSQKLGFDAIQHTLDLYEKLDPGLRPRGINIPTNATFINDYEKTSKVIEFITRSNKLGIPFYLSFSVDGKYMDKDNRQIKNNKEFRDDAFYDKLFDFAKTWKVGFHPMVYSNNISLWKDNFLWFMDMCNKFDIDPANVYLLEVRNKEWTDQQILDFIDFLEFLVKWSFHELCHEDKDMFEAFLFRGKGFNILSNLLTSTDRGLGCSLQCTLYIRLGDLRIVPCHRTMYKGFELAKFTEDENGNISGIESVNPELMIGIYSFNSNCAPYCSNCLIKNICSKGCLGAQYEATGDMFTPIPTVCMMEHGRVKAIISALEEVGMLDRILSRVQSSKRTTIMKYRKLW